jgi:hypothetical protein
MNDMETNPPAQDSSLEWQVAALQRQVFLLLLALVVISATVVFYLFCQGHFLSKDLSDIQPQATQIIRNFNQHRQDIENFRSQLGSYATTHPAFQPVLKRYGWSASTPPKPQ